MSRHGVSWRAVVPRGLSRCLGVRRGMSPVVSRALSGAVSRAVFRALSRVVSRGVSRGVPYFSCGG